MGQEGLEKGPDLSALAILCSLAPWNVQTGKPKRAPPHPTQGTRTPREGRHTTEGRHAQMSPDNSKRLRIHLASRVGSQPALPSPVWQGGASDTGGWDGTLHPRLWCWVFMPNPLHPPLQPWEVSIVRPTLRRKKLKLKTTEKQHTVLKCHS